MSLINIIKKSLLHTAVVVTSFSGCERNEAEIEEIAEIAEQKLQIAQQKREVTLEEYGQILYKHLIGSYSILINRNNNEEAIQILEILVTNNIITAQNKVEPVHDLMLKYEETNNSKKIEQLLLSLEQQNILLEKIPEYKFRLLILYNNINNNIDNKNINNENKIDVVVENNSNNQEIKLLAEELQEQYKDNIYSKLSFFYLGKFYEKELLESLEKIEKLEKLERLWKLEQSIELQEKTELQEKAAECFAQYAVGVRGYIKSEEGQKYSINIITDFISSHPVEEALFLENRILSIINFK